MSATRSVSPTTSSMLRTRKTTPKANNNNIRKPTKQRSTNAMATFTSPSSRRSSWSIARSSARCGVQTKTTLTTTTMMKKNESNNKTLKEQQQQQRRNATITKANEDDSSSSSSSVDASSDDPFEFGSKSKKRRQRDGKST